MRKRIATTTPPASFLADLQAAGIMAIAFSIIAAIPLAAYGLISLVQPVFGYPALVSPREWLSIVVLVLASYALAALLAGVVFAVSRPIRRTLIGSMLVGAVMTPAIYGSIGFMAIMLWEPAGRLLFGDDGMTRDEFAEMSRVMLVLFTIVGLVAGPYLRNAWGKKPTAR